VKDDGTGRIESVMSEGAVPDVQQTVSPKDKKKLDKEAKAREKKEKAETKRLLKEQERKIKEEAKKKDETPTERRRRRRHQNEAGSHGNQTMLSVWSPKRPGVQSKHMRPCKVHLLDGTDYDLELDVSIHLCVRRIVIVDLTCGTWTLWNFLRHISCLISCVYSVMLLILNFNLKLVILPLICVYFYSILSTK